MSKKEKIEANLIVFTVISIIFSFGVIFNIYREGTVSWTTVVIFAVAWYSITEVRDNLNKLRKQKFIDNYFTTKNLWGDIFKK
jgi:hypothetical protein